MVRQSLRGDLKTAFAGEEETVVESLPGGRFFVSGWVDLLSDEAPSDRQNFSIVVFKDAAGKWAGEQFTLLPQI